MTARDTIRETIQRSIVMHPTTLGDMLETVACTHTLAASLSFGDKEAKRIAARMATEVQECAELVREYDVDGIMAGTMCQWQTAYMMACKLQCIPGHVQHEVMTALDAGL